MTMVMQAEYVLSPSFLEPARNAFHLAGRARRRYFDALERADADASVRVIVVTGAGSQFCVGADMDLLSVIGTEGASKVEVPARSTDQIQALEIKKPIIAAVNGAVAGLGFVLALSADVRFCTADSKWTTAFAKRGTLADSATRFTMLHSPATARPMHARQYCTHLQHYTQDRTNRVLVK